MRILDLFLIGSASCEEVVIAWFGPCVIYFARIIDTVEKTHNLRKTNLCRHKADQIVIRSSKMRINISQPFMAWHRFVSTRSCQMDYKSWRPTCADTKSIINILYVGSTYSWQSKEKQTCANTRSIHYFWYELCLSIFQGLRKKRIISHIHYNFLSHSHIS